MPVIETYPIQEFLNYLTFQKRYSKNTILSYQNDLSGFFEFILLEYSITDVKQITTPIIRTWLASLKENKISSKTINRKISSLKSFFKYQLRIKNLLVNPVSPVSSLKTNRRLPSFIEQKDINTLLNNDNFEKRKNFPDFPVTCLLINKKGKQLYPKYVYNVVRANLSKVSFNQRKSP